MKPTPKFVLFLVGVKKDGNRIKAIADIAKVLDCNVKMAAWLLSRGESPLCEIQCEYFRELVYTSEEAEPVLALLRENLIVETREAGNMVFGFGAMAGPAPWN